MGMKLENKLTAAAVISAIVIPVCNTAILGSLGVITGNDVAYPERLSQILNYAKEIINILSLFISSVVLSYSFALKKSAKASALICFLSIPTVYFTASMVDLGFYGTQAVSAVYVIPMLINSIFEALRYLLVIAASINIVKKPCSDRNLEVFSFGSHLSRCTVITSIIIFCTLLISNATDTISMLIEYGAPINSSELTYLITPYLTAIVYTAAGYLLSVFLGQKIIKHRA